MKKVLITGGAGFIGSNLAHRLAKNGSEVIIFDNLSRNGSEINCSWLKSEVGNISVFKGDIRCVEQLEECFKKNGPFDEIYHLAAQVAVTTSVKDPREDFEINATGTFNLLETVRTYSPESILLYSSTNKVYGEMRELVVEEKNNRYVYKDFPSGITEKNCLDFHSPYGCSKGAADQYVLDYKRIYGLKTIVFRQSCIYGYRQFGIEDQGWIAWFAIAAYFNKPVTIYGDGKQVRDVLFIDDLIDAYTLAVENIEVSVGNAYNIGGSHFNMSLLELIDYLEQFYGRDLEHSFSDWRPGDQKVFVADIAKAKKDFGWEPKVDVKKGVENLTRWVTENRDIFKDVGIL